QRRDDEAINQRPVVLKLALGRSQPVVRKGKLNRLTQIFALYVEDQLSGFRVSPDHVASCPESKPALRLQVTAGNCRQVLQRVSGSGFLKRHTPDLGIEAAAFAQAAYDRLCLLVRWVCTECQNRTAQLTLLLIRTLALGWAAH